MKDDHVLPPENDSLATSMSLLERARLGEQSCVGRFGADLWPIGSSLVSRQGFARR